jgi:hypothetical protein
MAEQVVIIAKVVKVMGLGSGGNQPSGYKLGRIVPVRLPKRKP